MGRSQARRPKERHLISLRGRIQLARIYLKPQSAKHLLALLSFLRRHIILGWLMLWAGLAGATVAAITTIINPNAAAPVHQPAPIISSAQPVPSLTPRPSLIRLPTSKPRTRAASPISTVGAILLSCASGCFLLSRCLTPRPLLRAKKRPDLAGKPARRPVRRSENLPEALTTGQPAEQSAQTANQSTKL